MAVERVNQAVVFGRRSVSVDAQRFRGGRVSATFGTLEIDLRAANLAPEGAELALASNLGSIIVRVPVGWPVIMLGLPPTGGCAVRVQNTEIANRDGAALRIRCTGAFGKIEITN